MNYYERHIGDYLKDTAHLSLLEHGIYTRLLDVYYTREEGLPPDQIARLIGARGKDELVALKAVLAEFFVLDGTTHKQERCEREIARFKDKQEKAKRSAEARWNKPASQSERNANAEHNGDAVGMRTHNERNADGMPHARLSQSPVTSHQTPEVLSERGGLISETANLPAHQTTISDWKPRPDTIKQLVVISGVPQQFIDEKLAEFRMYWRDRDQPKTSWDSAFFKDCNREWKGNGHNWKPAPEKLRGSTFDDLTDTSWAAGLADSDIPDLIALPGGKP